jgi:hypothetical protein
VAATTVRLPDDLDERLTRYCATTGAVKNRDHAQLQPQGLFVARTDQDFNSRVAFILRRALPPTLR